MTPARGPGGIITSQDIADFTLCGCYLLAAEIETVTGWPRAAFWDGFRAAGHMFSALPGDRFLDITGVHTRAEMMATHWAQPGKRHGRRGITTRYADDSGWRCGVDETRLRARARQLVPVLLAQCETPPGGTP
jgi:hypothetical protein